MLFRKKIRAQNIWTCTLVFLRGLRASSWVLLFFKYLSCSSQFQYTSKASLFWLSNPTFSLGENKNWFQRRCKILTKRNNANNTKIFTFKKENFSQFGWQFFIFGIWLRWQILIKPITFILFYFFWEIFNLWCLHLMMALYHQI